MNKVRNSQTVKSGQIAKLLSVVAAKFNSPEEVASHLQAVKEGFEPWEQEVVRQFMQKRGRLLDIGCGAGREALAFASLGFEVVGVDLAEKMIEQARALAAGSGVNVEFHVASVTECEFPPESFDYIFFSRAVYSYIPTRELRLATLARLRRMLKPSGLLVLSGYFVARRRLRRRTLIDVYRSLGGRLFGRWMKYEPGDTLVGQVSENSDLSKPCFVHVFPSLAAIDEELRQSRFSTISDKRRFYFVATPADADVRVVKSAEFDGLASELLAKGFHVRFTVSGTSMRPFLEEGEKVILAPVNPQNLKIGDVALVRRPGQTLTLHRLVKKITSQRLFVFKGDAITECDEPVGADQVIGQVLEIEKQGKRLRLQGPLSSLRNHLLAEHSIIRAACSRALHRLRPT